VLKKLQRTAEDLTPESIEARLEEMARKLDRLRGMYESFFMGVERTPPNHLRRELNRLMLEMQQVPITKPTLRFRFQTMLQKWVLFTTYWNRTLREIESGTFRRDIAKARRMLQQRGTALTEEEAISLGIPANRVKAFVARQQRATGAADAKPPAAGTPPAGEFDDVPTDRTQTVPAADASSTEGHARVDARPATAAQAKSPTATPQPPRPQPAAPARSGTGPGGLGDKEVERFYQRFVDAHVSANGAPPRTTMAQLRAKLEAEIPRLMAERRCSRVDLDVSVDGGKVRLKLRPVQG
jgi:hypothetical protein